MNPTKSIMEMARYSAPTADRLGFLRLDFNENTVGLPKSLWNSFSRIPPEELSAYPDCGGLEAAIAKYAKVKQDQIIACNGSDEAIRIALQCFVGYCGEVVIPSPSFAMFEQYAAAMGAKVRNVLYKKNLKFPTSAALRAISKKTRAVILCNPNNPTGTAIDKKSIERILRKAEKNSALVLIDEAYFEFSRETSVPLLKKFGNLAIARTFSKAFGLAGLRLGYIISSTENCAEMRKAASPYSVSSATSFLAIRALRKRKYVQRYVAEVLAAKKITERGLRNLGLRFYPGKGNFLLVDFGEDCRRIISLLREGGILVRDRSSDKMLDGCARVTIGTRAQMRLFLSELEKNLKRKTLIFDMDGVLVDVSRSYRRAVQETVRCFAGERLSLGRIQALKNKFRINNDWLFSKKIIESLGKKAALPKVVEKFQKKYLGKKFDGLIRNEKLLLKKSTMRQLGEKFDLLVFTGRPGKEAAFALRRFGIESAFKKVVAMEDIPSRRQKPDPFGLWKILGKNKNAVYVGDTLQDIECAKRAGIGAIGVLPPQDKSRKLRKKMLQAGADFVLNDVNKIMEEIA